jgi:hypothetical protein
MNTPTDIDTVSGASFPLVIQCLSTVLVASIGVAAWAGRASLAPWFESMQWMALCVAVSAMVMWGYLNILFSRTSLGPAGLSQGWLLQTRVPLTDITRVKFLRVRGLDWLLAPRMVTRAHLRGAVTFWSADPRVIERMDRLAYGGVLSD